MERLTIRNNEGKAYFRTSPISSYRPLPEGTCQLKVLDRLAEYEDTGYTPEGIKQEIDCLKGEKEVYRKHWLDLCDKILAELDKDGWCRLTMTKEEALEMKRIFDELK